MIPLKITPALLRELIRYEPETGKLFWKERDVRFFANAGNAFLWNANNVGKEIARRGGTNEYKDFQIFGQVILAHRAAWAIQHGKWPDKIDHIHGQCGYNVLGNMRDASALLNARNRVLQSNNTSGHVGVGKTKNGRWYARILNKRLGCFDTFEEAVKARQEAQTATPGFTERHGKPRIVNYGFSHLKHSRLQRKLKREFA